jgi:phage terminase large subunit
LVEADPLLEEAKKPLCLDDEIVGYTWQKTQDGKPDKEQPVKVDDHGCDTMRYIVKYVESGYNPRDLVDFA